MIETSALRAYTLLLLSAMCAPVCLAQAAENTGDTAQSKVTDSSAEEVLDADVDVDADADADAPVSASNPPQRIKLAPQNSLQHSRLVKAHYPEGELITLNAENQPFNALWRLNQRGETFGAVVIMPTRGQHANWPDTVAIMRDELSMHGWHTLSIEVEGSTTLSSDMPEGIADSARLLSAIEFLQAEGQFNIVAIGYGSSATETLNYAALSEAPGLGDNTRGNGQALSRPLSGLIMIGALSYSAQRLSTKLRDFPYKDMPILDLVTGTHYLDTFDAKARKKESRRLGFSNYLQVKLTQPAHKQSALDGDNPLIRRVRGFLEKHAKGVEIEK